MKMILLFIMSFYALPDIGELRNKMDKSVASKTVAQAFFDQLQGVTENDKPLLVGFRAMSELLMAKHVLSPFSKLSHFKKGKNLLEAALKRDPLNPELIYFRFSTQSNVPAMLNYSDELEADKKKLISWLKENKSKLPADVTLHQRIKSFLIIDKHCSAAEKALLKTL